MNEMELAAALAALQKKKSEMDDYQKNTYEAKGVYSVDDEANKVKASQVGTLPSYQKPAIGPSTTSSMPRQSQMDSVLNKPDSFQTMEAGSSPEYQDTQWGNDLGQGRSKALNRPWNLGDKPAPKLAETDIPPVGVAKPMSIEDEIAALTPEQRDMLMKLMTMKGQVQ